MTGIVDGGFPILISYGEMSFLRRVLQEEKLRMFRAITKGSPIARRMGAEELRVSMAEMFTLPEECRHLPPLSDEHRVALLLEKCDAIEQECQAALRTDNESPS